MESVIYKTINEDRKDFLHVAVLYGGMSKEREVSLMSGAEVIKSLSQMDYRVTPIDMASDIAVALDKVKPDLVFNALHGTYGEDGCIQGLLEIMGIAYTHSGVLASAIALDKISSQNIVASNDILTPKRKIVKKEDNLDCDPIRRPYVIKPINEGSNIGVEVVLDEDDFDFANYKFEYGNTVIIEEYIEGKEIQVAIIAGIAVGTLEIQLLAGKRFYDYQAKYEEGFANHICPANIPADANSAALKIAEKIHNLLGCKGATRAEFRYNEKENKLYFLEINTHPGFTKLSIVPEIAMKCKKIDFKQLLQILINEACNENAIKREKKNPEQKALAF